MKNGYWTKLPSRNGNGVRYLDGKGGPVQPVGIRVPLAGNLARSSLMDPSKPRAKTFEQDLLWSVLEQDAVPHILTMAKEHWNVDPPTAWSKLVELAVLGRLRAYRGTQWMTSVDITATSIDEAALNYEFFVEPTEATRTRLAQIG